MSYSSGGNVNTGCYCGKSHSRSWLTDCSECPETLTVTVSHLMSLCVAIFPCLSNFLLNFLNFLLDICTCSEQKSTAQGWKFFKIFHFSTPHPQPTAHLEVDLSVIYFLACFSKTAKNQENTQETQATYIMNVFNPIKKKRQINFW